VKELVRIAFYREKKSRSEIARQFGISRKTVRKLLNMPADEIPRYHLRQPKQRPVLEKFIPIIDAWLKADETAPKKQRHTAKRIYDRLCAEYEFKGSERTVRQYVAQARQKLPEVFLPLAFSPGEMAQVDWAEVWVRIAGIQQKVFLFGMTLNYSGGIYFEAFDRMAQEAFFQGHANAFAFFKGVPWTITYDNLASAVKKVLKGRNREENERFASFRSAYLFESRFCNPARGNEKGRVENMMKFAERNLFTPVPCVNSLQELNELIRQRCLDYQKHTQARQTQTVGERLEQERPLLSEIPAYRPECCRITSVTVDKSSMVQFETNRYSVPTEYAYQTLWLKAFVDRVEITDKEKIIATHPRLKGRLQESIRFEHYRKVLERKPGAFEHLRAQDKEPLALKTKEPGQSPYPKTTVKAPDLSIYRSPNNPLKESTS
jgi:transposase